MWSNFAVLDFVVTDTVVLSLPAKISANYILRRFEPETDFTWVNHLDWGFIFATKIIVNDFNKTVNIVPKESVTCFKKCQRAK